MKLVQEIEDFSQGYEETRNEPIHVKLENVENELNSLQDEEEQTMKYRGITIHKNKNCTTWYTRYRINGVQSYISARTQQDCYDKLKKALKHADNKASTIRIKAEKPKSRCITLKEWYDKWLKIYKLGKIKATTLKVYQSTIIHIPKKIFDKPLDRIDIEDISDILNNCKAPRQKQKLYELLNMIFEKAKQNDIITKNVVINLDKPKHEKNHGIALTNKEQSELIEKCKDIANIDVMLVALYQGLRRGEVLGLTIDNLDFKNNTLTINKAWSERNEFDTTKNKQSMRTMPLFETTKQILIKYKHKKERVFDISNQACSNMIEAVRKRMNIPKLHLKDMRSTFITRCKELQVPIHVIQSWVGHVIGSTVTDTVYTKHNKEIDANYINIINKTDFKS